MTTPTYVLPLPAPVAVPVAGSTALLPLHRIYCVGRNYADHAREMGAIDQAEGREPPFFFSKPVDAVCTGAEVPYPPATENLHHEVELVVALGRGGSNIKVEAALACVYGYAVGLDLTRRDLQARAKAKGHPWDMGKGFDASAPLTGVVPVAQCGHPAAGRIDLSVDGQLRQQGDLADMLWSVPEIIAELSRLVTLCPGDLIFTGTPAGVGPVARGAVIEAAVAGVGQLRVTLV